MDDDKTVVLDLLTILLMLINFATQIYQYISVVNILNSDESDYLKLFLVLVISSSIIIVTAFPLYDKKSSITGRKILQAYLGSMMWGSIPIGGIASFVAFINVESFSPRLIAVLFCTGVPMLIIAIFGFNKWSNSAVEANRGIQEEVKRKREKETVKENYSGEGVFISKSCGACGKEVSIHSKAGQRCPHCAAVWSYKKTIGYVSQYTCSGCGLHIPPKDANRSTCIYCGSRWSNR